MMILMTSASSVPNSLATIFRRFMPGVIATYYTIVIATYSRDRRARCGDFHSIKWYKENRRVFVYSPVVDFSKAEGELLERSSLALDAQVYIKYIIYPSILVCSGGIYQKYIIYPSILVCPGGQADDRPDPHDGRGGVQVRDHLPRHQQELPRGAAGQVDHLGQVSKDTLRDKKYDQFTTTLVSGPSTPTSPFQEARAPDLSWQTVW